MKDGAAADPLEGPPDDEPTSETADPLEAKTRDRDHDAGADTTTTSTPDIPYIFRRETVLEDREQKPLYLKPDTQDRLDAFQTDLNDRYDRDVKKSDIKEASLVAAIEGETVYTVLERWGYGR